MSKIKHIACCWGFPEDDCEYNECSITCKCAGGDGKGPGHCARHFVLAHGGSIEYGSVDMACTKDKSKTCSDDESCCQHVR